MKKRKKGEEEAEVTREQQALIQTEPSMTKSPPKKGKGKDSQPPQKGYYWNDVITEEHLNDVITETNFSIDFSAISE